MLGTFSEALARVDEKIRDEEVILRKLRVRVAKVLGLTKREKIL